jgi:hypothetical protein
MSIRSNASSPFTRAAGALALMAALGLGCAGGLVTAPHRSRERELAPAAAESRSSVVAERAAYVERQNPKSRDVYWFRAWRAQGLLGLGQLAEGEQLVDQTTQELGYPEVSVAEPQRLRMFLLDLKAQAALARQSPQDALVSMERALSIALEVKPSTGGDCDADLALAARNRRLSDVAQASGDEARARRAEAEVARRLEAWSICLARLDFPAMQPLWATKGRLAVGDGAPSVVAVAAPAPAPRAAPVSAAPAAPAPATPAAPAAAPVPAAPKGASLGLRTVSHKYGPFDPTPYKDAMEPLIRVVERSYKGAKGDTVIRLDGARRALRLTIATKKLEGVAALAPIFKACVVFFEKTREVEPKIDEVMVVVETADGPITLLAQKSDVFDLFVERIDAAGFAGRVLEVR